jgi:hypothetical protein
MQVLLAVIHDLVTFVLQSFTRAVPTRALSTPALPLFIPEVPLTLAPIMSPTLLSTPSTPTLLPAVTGTIHDPIGSPEVVYVCVDEALLFREPTLSVDGVVAKLPYTSVLTVVAAEGLFWRVVYEVGTAWIEKSVVVHEKMSVYPVFTPGLCYLALDTETKKLRRLIKDEFFTTRVHSPLLGVEYVTYRLQERGRTIDWSSSVRPRLAGTWHQLLKGVRGVTIKVSPKTGSIMEYGTGETATLAYVESVAPDETISISSIGQYKPGQYTEVMLSKTAWQELQPLWLQIN